MSRLTVPLLLAVILMCAGCLPGIPISADRVKWESMTARGEPSIHQGPSTIAVSVLGGHEPSKWYAFNVPSYISDEDFASALRQSIEQSKLFARVLKEGSANYQLQAFMRQLDQQISGGSITVTMKVVYALLRNEPKQIVWRKAMTSTFTLPPSTASWGPTESRLATEGGARRNIEQAIQEMSQLRLE